MAPLPVPTTDLDPTCAQAMLNAVRAALPEDPEADEDAVKAQHWFATRILGHLKPANPLEAMFASHAVAAHFAAMDDLRRAADTDQPDDAALRLRKGAHAMARLAEDSTRLLQRQRTPQRTPKIARVRAPDALARATRAARGADVAAEARETTAHQNEPGQDPMHQSVTGAGASGTAAGDPARNPAGTGRAPAPAAETRQHLMHLNMLSQPGEAGPTAPWTAGLPDEAFAEHLTSLSIEDLLALTDRMTRQMAELAAAPAASPSVRPA